MVQVGVVPLQASPQPPKMWPLAGVAVSVSEPPLAKRVAQALPATPQLIPAGALDTVPWPLPYSATLTG